MAIWHHKIVSGLHGDKVCRQSDRQECFILFRKHNESVQVQATCDEVLKLKLKYIKKAAGKS